MFIYDQIIVGREPRFYKRRHLFKASQQGRPSGTLVGYAPVTYIHTVYCIGHRGLGARGWDLNATVVSSIPTRGNELFFLNTLIFSLWHEGKKPSVEFGHLTSGERSVLYYVHSAINVMCGIQREADFFHLYLPF